jgi:hypothetical protein
LEVLGVDGVSSGKVKPFCRGTLRGVEENPYKPPKEFDADREGISAAFPFLRTTISRFPPQFWISILALLAAQIALGVFFFTLQARGVPHALLYPYFIDAHYVLIGLWGFAGFLMRGHQIYKLLRKNRRQHYGERTGRA